MPASWSTIAGILLFGLRAKNSGLNCSFALMSTAIARYGSPTSSSMIDTFRPFGVVHVYKSIMKCALAHKGAAILPALLATQARLANHGRRRKRDGCAMPLGLLTLVIQVIAAVHLLRSRGDMRWLFLIILVPGIGALIYFFVEVLPALGQNPAARKALRRAKHAIDPGRGLREGSLNYERSQNVDTAIGRAATTKRFAFAQRRERGSSRTTRRFCSRWAKRSSPRAGTQRQSQPSTTCARRIPSFVPPRATSFMRARSRRAARRRGRSKST